MKYCFFLFPAILSLAACSGTVGSLASPGYSSPTAVGSRALPNDCFIVALEAKKRLQAAGVRTRLLSSNQHVVAVIEDQGRLYAYDARGARRLYVDRMAHNSAASVARGLYGYNVRGAKWLEPSL